MTDVVLPSTAAAPADAAPTFRYWAFVSYAHGDAKAAVRLHHALETYRLPRELVGTVPAHAGRGLPAPLYPIFLDRDELAAAASLGERLESALRDSLSLIVVCSPNAVRSRWVDQEARYFKSLGREAAGVLPRSSTASPAPGSTPVFRCRAALPRRWPRRADGRARRADRRRCPAPPARRGGRRAAEAGCGNGRRGLRRAATSRAATAPAQAGAGRFAPSALVLVLAGLARLTLSSNATPRWSRCARAGRLVAEGAANVARVAVDEEPGWQGLLAASLLAPDAGADATLNDLLRRSPRAPRVIAAGHATRIRAQSAGRSSGHGRRGRAPPAVGRVDGAGDRRGLAGARRPRDADRVRRGPHTDVSRDHGYRLQPGRGRIASASGDTSVRLGRRRRHGHRRASARSTPGGQRPGLPAGRRAARVGRERFAGDVGCRRQPLTRRGRDRSRAQPRVRRRQSRRAAAGRLQPRRAPFLAGRHGQRVGRAWQGHLGGMLAAAFSPDGARLVSAGEDGTLVQWDVAKGRALGAPWRGHEGPVRSVEIPRHACGLGR